LACPECPVAAALGRLVTIGGLLFSPNRRAVTPKQVIMKTEVVCTFEHVPPGCRMPHPVLSIGQAYDRCNAAVGTERKVARHGWNRRLRPSGAGHHSTELALHLRSVRVFRATMAARRCVSGSADVRAGLEPLKIPAFAVKRAKSADPSGNTGPTCLTGRHRWLGCDAQTAKSRTGIKAPKRQDHVACGAFAFLGVQGKWRGGSNSGFSTHGRAATR
jgi:hypothetical protein